MQRLLRLKRGENLINSGTTVHDIISSKEANNFNLLRLLASLMVVYGHSFQLFFPNGYRDIIPLSSGEWAVNGFFFISGILITQSYFKSETYRFWIMRSFRIWPALIVCIFLTAFVIGPIVTTHTLNEYFASPLLKRYVLNITLLRGYMNQILPGVFTHNYEDKLVNGSLWTLPYEVLCYALLFVTLEIIRTFKRKHGSFLKIVITSLIIIFIATPSKLNLIIQQIATDPHCLRLFYYFGFGSMVFFLSRRITVNTTIFISIVAIIYALSLLDMPYIMLGVNVAFMYFILWFAQQPQLKKLRINNDYSYGIYIYGCLVQQIVANYWPTTSYKSMLITLPATYLLGVLSWHLVEKRALAFAKRLSNTITT